MSNAEKEMQSFINKINIVKICVPCFAKTIRKLQKMIKKDVVFKWILVENETFDKKRSAIAKYPAPHSPDFNEYFFLYTFSSDHSFVVVLTQKNKQGDGHPISFMSTRI
jgi:hypothetical protein